MDDIGGAISMYAVDHDETFPLGSTPSGPTGLGWAGRVALYFRKPASSTLSRFRDPAEKRDEVMSYALNANVSAVRTTTAVAGEERAVLLFEVQDAKLGGVPEFGTPFRLSPVGDGTTVGLRDSTDLKVSPVVRYADQGSGGESRHGDRLNVLCADGHMTTTRVGPISAGGNATAASNPESSAGCRRPDLPGVGLACAQGSARREKPLTYSLR